MTSVSVAYRPKQRNDGGEWVLVIMQGALVNHIILPVNGRASKDDAADAARRYIERLSA
jgi:hypothetical protein